MKKYVWGCVVLLAGCKVGPDYRMPCLPVPNHYTEWQNKIVVEEDLSVWWHCFNDPCLDRLIQRTIRGSFDLKIAVEKVCQARAQYWVQFTTLLPEFDYVGSGTRSRISQTTTGALLSKTPYQDFYLAGFDAVWQLDFFGGLQRSAAASYDTWQAIAEDSRNVKIVVISEVAHTYTLIRTYQNQVAIAKEVVCLDEELVRLAKDREVAGLNDEQAFEAALATLEADKADLTVLETDLQQTIYALSTLVGATPESLAHEFQQVGTVPYAMGLIPVGLPSDLLRRRPDIHAAERRLAAATEQIGAAVAELFPNISLTGSTSSYSSNPVQGSNVGFASNNFNKLFNSGSFLWGIGGLMVGPLWDFGKRMSAVDVQSSLQRQALIAYEQTVITALKEVESALVAYFNEEKRLCSLERQEKADLRSLELTKDLFAAGLANYTEVMTSKEAWLSAVSMRVNSQMTLATDLIAVYKAMGGDWACSYSP